MTEMLPFNPNVLQWARARSGLEIEDVARKINTSVERIVEWENPNGNRQPTVKQARKLAAAYGRPFLEFFSKQLPVIQDVALAPDYRFHRIPPSDVEIKVLENVHRWAEEQRLNALDLMGMLGDIPVGLPEEIYATINDDVENIAQKVRELASFSIEEQTRLRVAERRLLPNMLRELFSKFGVLVLKQNEIRKARTRGICIFAEPLPIIVYGNEAPSAQAFTLAHEFAHVIIKKSAISNTAKLARTITEGSRVENWCNNFAAAFLIPSNALSQILNKPIEPFDEFEDQILSEVAESFAVSRHAMLIRLVNLGYVKSSYYWQVMQPRFVEEEESYEAPPMRSRYYGSRYKNSRGSFYTSLVMEAWQTGLISAHNAAEFMGIKNLSHLDDIRKDIG